MLEIGICEDMSMQNSGHFFDRFGGIRQHTSRKMVENGSKVLRGLTMGFEVDRRHTQLSSVSEVVCASLEERVAELHTFEGFHSAGEL